MMLVVLSAMLRAMARAFAAEPGAVRPAEGGNVRALRWPPGHAAAARPDVPVTRGHGNFVPAVWWPALKRAGAGFLEDRVMAEAAGVAFFAMLAVFPAMASLISIYGLVADPARLAFEVQGLSGVLPQGGIDIITGEMKSLASSGHSALGLGLVLSLAVSLWSANAGVKALFDALNTVYHEKEKRTFVRLTLISFCFTLGIIALLMAATVAVVVVPVVLNFVGFGSLTAMLIDVLRWPVMLAAVAFALEVIYRFGPSRPHATWHWMSWGSALAALVWLLTSLAFSYYVANFGSYNRTYGSLGAAMGFMTWIWLSSMVVLMGAELNSELEGR
jgi:membrane protein